MVATFHAVSSAAQASKYFEKDNYYTKDGGYGDSQWMGKAAAALGLAGNIKPDEFRKILEGEVAGQKLGKWGKNEETGDKEWQHRPGLDITLSVAKSASMTRQLGGDERLRAALYEAAQATLGMIEQEYSIARVTTDGKTRAELTGNLVAAVFHHDLARAAGVGATPDPDDHMHLVFGNATRCADGRWRSLDMAPMRKHIKTIGAVLHAEFRQRAEALGYETDTIGINGEFEFRGMSRGEIEHFSQRGEQIEGHLKEQGLTRATASSEQKQVANLDTRSGKERVDREQVRQTNLERAEKLGLDLPGLVAAAKERAKSLIERTPEQSAEAAKRGVSWALGSLQERSFVNSRSDILREALSYAQGAANYKDIAQEISVREKNGEMILAHTERQAETGIVSYTTPAALKLERTMLKNINTGIGAVVPIATLSVAEKQLQGWEQTTKLELNPGQRDAALAVVTTSDRYTLIQGSAGVGKTTLVNGIKAIAENHGVRLRGLAQGGSQSKTLQQETGIKSSTIASFVATARGLDVDVLRERHGGELWIVDEMSQASQQDATTLVRLSSVAGARVAFVGDKEQMLSIESGTAMALAMSGSRIAVKNVEEIVRQRDARDREMVSMAAKGHVAEAIAERITQTPDLIGEAACRYAALTPTLRDKSIVLTGLNADRHGINEAIRGHLRKEGRIASAGEHGTALISTNLSSAQKRDARSWLQLERQTSNSERELVVQILRKYEHMPTEAGEILRVKEISAANNTLIAERQSGEQVAINLDRTRKVEALFREERIWSVGDQVRFTNNERQAGIANGDAGRIVGHHDGVLRIETGGIEVAVTAHNARIDYGYAATVHASQGWGKENVVWAARAEHGTEVLDARAGYVAISRAKGETQIVTDNKVKLLEALEVRRDNESAMASVGEVKLKDDVIAKFESHLAAKAKQAAQVNEQQQRIARDHGHGM